MADTLRWAASSSSWYHQPIASAAREVTSIALERTPITCIVSGGAELVGALGRREEINDASYGMPKTVDGSLGGLSQERHELGEGVIDRVEVGGRAGGSTPRRRPGSLRERIEEVFDWIKARSGRGRQRSEGSPRCASPSTFAAAPYNLVRIPKLLED